MSCSACSNGLEKYLNKQDGINQATVNLVMANAMIDYDEAKVTRKMLDKFVKDAGFESLGIYNENEEEKTGSSKKILFIVFAALSVILMYVSMGHMIGLPEIPLIGAMSNPLGYALALAVLTVPFLVYGFDILKSGIKNALHKMPNMDTLVALGVTSSFLYSVYGLIMTALGSTEHVHSLYFESSAIVIFFIKLGRYIDSVSKDRTKDAIKSLVQITPRDATIKLNGVEKSVTIDEIKKGDTVISRPGERIAVDGTVTAGRAHIDESFITGESKPALRKPGDRVIAGSTDYDGYIEYRAEKIGRESTISEIVRIVVEATSTKAPLARIADTISGFFVPAIILIALLSFIGYLLAGQSFAAALNTFVTVLVVACPCSLGLATPLAIVVSEGKCAGKGILIKRSEVLENASKTDTVV
ncbi:MAG: heavy metal translocating P-type ATPase, partial [Clostridia bacterium]|nr:heavy metal translocating P-type ATPase [Clostridia bacterium]